MLAKHHETIKLYIITSFSCCWFLQIY